MNQNEIRRAMCKHDQSTLDKFDRCYTRAGLNATVELELDSKMAEEERQRRIKEELDKFQSLIVRTFIFLDTYPLNPPVGIILIVTYKSITHNLDQARYYGLNFHVVPILRLNTIQ